MKKTKSVVILALLLSALLTCDLFEPEQKNGAIAVNFVLQQQLAKSAQTEEALAAVQCALSKGSKTIHDNSYNRTGASFKIDLNDLEPAEDYTILLYGKNSRDEMIGRAYKNGIRVTAGQVTSINMSWDEFRTTLQTPAAGAVINSFPISFKWSLVAGAQTYELCAANNSSFTSPVISQQIPDSTTVSVSETLDDGQYYWRVKCQDTQGNWGGWSAAFGFTVETPGPAAPTLISPENNAALTMNAPEFDWTDVSDVIFYEMTVDDNSNFASAEISRNDISASAFSATTPLADATYYWRVRAQDANGNWGGWSSVWSFTVQSSTSPFCEEFSAVTDIDGNVYETVKIGDQWWMAENLKVTQYRNGDPIPNVTDNSQWANLTTGAWCAFNNDPVNADTYGLLYNWYAVNDSRTIAPEGWHVPTDEEWKQLEMALGMSRSEADDTGYRGADEGGKMKATGTRNAGTGLWLAPNTGATNESCFSSLPGGYRSYYGTYYYMGASAYFWSSTESGSDYAWYRYMYYNYSDVRRRNDYEESGFSVRCVRD